MNDIIIIIHNSCRNCAPERKYFSMKKDEEQDQSLASAEFFRIKSPLSVRLFLLGLLFFLPRMLRGTTTFASPVNNDKMLSKKYSEQNNYSIEVISVWPRYFSPRILWPNQVTESGNRQPRQFDVIVIIVRACVPRRISMLNCFGKYRQMYFMTNELMKTYLIYYNDVEQQRQNLPKSFACVGHRFSIVLDAQWRTDGCKKLFLSTKIPGRNVCKNQPCVHVLSPKTYNIVYHHWPRQAYHQKSSNMRSTIK